MDPLNRIQLKAFTAQKFIDNVLQAITPEDARDVIYAVIDSTGLLVDELTKKADLVNGKVPTTQLPITGMVGIPAWSSLVTYSVGNQVSYESRIWQSKINNNTNIPPYEGAIWTEISATHLQNTDTMLRLPDGTALTAQYILDNLGGNSIDIYRAQIKILAAESSYIFDPVAMVPAEYGLAEFAVTRESGVECMIEIPGNDPVIIPNDTEKTFNIKVLRFSVDEAYVYYCFTSLASAEVDLSSLVHKTGDENVDGIKTFLQKIVSDSQADPSLVKKAFDLEVDDGEGGTYTEIHSELQLVLDNLSETDAYQLLLSVASDAFFQILFSRPDGTFSGGITFGVGSTINSLSYRGVNLIAPKEDGSGSNSIRQYILATLATLNAYYAKSNSQKIGSLPMAEVGLAAVSGTVTIDMANHSEGRGKLSITSNITFAISDKQDGHVYVIHATTDSSSRTITLPANSKYIGSLTLDASSSYDIAVRARNVSGTWNYLWIINKYT